MPLKMWTVISYTVLRGEIGGENGSLLSHCFSGTVRLFENEKHFLINVYFCVL